MMETNSFQPVLSEKTDRTALACAWLNLLADLIFTGDCSVCMHRNCMIVNSIGKI